MINFRHKNKQLRKQTSAYSSEITPKGFSANKIFAGEEEGEVSMFEIEYKLLLIIKRETALKSIGERVNFTDFLISSID